MKLFFSIMTALLSAAPMQADEMVQPLPAIHYIDPLDTLMTSNWAGTDDLLFFDITLGDDLTFDNSFYITTLEKGWQCSIDIILAPNSYIKYKEDTLKSYSIDLVLENDAHKEKVAYKTIHNLTCDSLDEDGLKTTKTHTITRTGKLFNPNIDLFKEPTFETKTGASQQGRFTFTNQFPFSEIKG